MDGVGGTHSLYTKHLLANIEAPGLPLEQLFKRVRAAVARLPDLLRQAVILVYFQGLKYQDAADILDIPVGTVMSRLHRGRRILKRQLAEEALDGR